MYGLHTVMLLLIVHIMIGFRRLHDVAYYADDPMVARVLGLRRLPSAATPHTHRSSSAACAPPATAPTTAP